MPFDADAVNVTELPTSVGFCELDTETSGSGLTVSVIVEEVLLSPSESDNTTYIVGDPE